MQSTGRQNDPCPARRVDHFFAACGFAIPRGNAKQQAAYQGPSAMMKYLSGILVLFASVAVAPGQEKGTVDVTSVPGTKPLEMKGDIASELVAGVDRFLLKQIEKSVEERAKFWKR